MFVVTNNLMALNSSNQLKINVSTKAKSTEKLSSGYRINKAADDAAGLSISEKMRTMIKGLNQGSRNVEDGSSWVQTGDGALNEAHAIMHRMTELTIQSLNDTNTDQDRMALELEFESLQSELDRIGGTTTFNTLPIFEEHETPYYQCEGNIKWDPQQIHVISAGNNDLSFTYQATENSPQQTVSINVPPGQYTTQELVDEIESALGALPPTDEKLELEFTPEGTCNVNLEGGELINTISGGLSYLLNKVYTGGGFGALIGTTVFPTENSRLQIHYGENDTMTFTIEDFAGNSVEKTVTIPPNDRQGYTKQELIDIINNQLKDTTVKATSQGTGIKLSSDDSIVTGFKGNMFQIDEKGYDSIFYDNTKYGFVTKTEAAYTGGYVLPTNPIDEEHHFFDINDTNNTLILQPNTCEKPITITIPVPATPDERYTITKMRDFLNQQFQDNNLDLTVEAKESGGFQGLFITSGVEGLDSKINLDPTSSAYNTLFVNREYNQYGPFAKIDNEINPNKEANYQGSKILSGISSSAPLEIKAGVNNSFKLSLNGSNPPYTITLPERNYNSLQEVIDALDEQLNGANAPMAYKGKLSVFSQGGKIMLGGIPTENINSIRISANGNNQGYNDIFIGYREYSLPPVSNKGSVTLDTPFDGSIDPSQSNMTIIVDGKPHQVPLPTGPNVSQEDIKDAINIPAKTEPNRFPHTEGYGTSGDQNFSSTAVGRDEPTSPWTGDVKGDSYKPQGYVDFITNDPASLTVGPALKDSMKIDSSNDEIVLTINGVTKPITLDHETYAPGALVQKLQEKIDENFGKGLGGATVSLEGNNLVLEARLPEPEWMDGKDSSISCSTDTSSFLRALNTVKHPAEWESKLPLASEIVIDNNHNTFRFELTENGNTSTISVSLTASPQPYTSSSIVTEIDKKLAGTGVTASLSSGKLVLTSSKEGSNVSISYDTTKGGSSVEALFGSMTAEKPAQAVINQKIESPIVITKDASDTFNVTVNNQSYSITLDSGSGSKSYSRAEFVNMLNEKFKENNVDLKAYVSGNKIGFHTVTSKGSSASFSVDYDGGGNAMNAIFGVTTTPGITADFTNDGKLVISSTSPGSTITIPSSSNDPFQSKTEKRPVQPSKTDGYHSNKHSSVQGQPLSGDIVIDEWNRKLNFTYRNNDITKSASIEIPADTYTYSELETKVQELVNAKIGSGKVDVTVTSAGVRFQAVNVGSKYQFSSFSGGFYDKVMGKAAEQQRNQATTNTDGTQTISEAYIIGRKDIRHNGAEIRKGYTDTLKLDLTYGGKPTKIEVTLDEGNYTGEELRQHVQDKLNEFFDKNGMEKNTIIVGLGDRHPDGVHNSNDQNALNFRLPSTDDKIKLPEEGEYVIDGIGGNAAFEIFYHTEGKIIPSYIIGTKDISDGVELKPEDTEFSVDVDGVTYPVKIEKDGFLSSDELVEEVSKALEKAGAPLFAVMENNCLKISHKNTGEHVIDKMTGPARDNLFFSENGNNKEKPPLYIKPNSIKDDGIAITRYRFNTPYLNVNSICISKPKYAEKALERLRTALDMTSEIRSYFGSMQNRLEHTYNNNKNMEENTQSSESRLRDADMAEEMMKFASSSILQQANESILVQANQQPQKILSLFQ